MIKIAIVGTGAISDTHLRAYGKFRGHCQVVALVDLYPDKARAKAAEHGLPATVYPNYQELLAKEHFDAASVCLPPFGHAEAAQTLLRARKHVLVEKPMATCLEECDAMLAAAEAGGSLLSVVAQSRFKTPMMKLKAILDSGRIGRILHAQVDSFWWRGGRYYDLWWRGTWEKEGGGCTMNHAVHHIDIFQWLRGLPSSLQAVTLNLGHENSEVEDFSTAILTYADGSVGQITASLVHHGESQQLIFQGEHARVSVPWQVLATDQRDNGFPQDNPALAAQLQADYDRLPAVTEEGHDGQIQNFLEAIAGRQELLVDGHEGRKTIELITAIYQSGHLGRAVTLPLGPRDPFYTREGILQRARRYHQKTRNVENFNDNTITLGGNYGR
ncbi:MAG: Gfo/Idh/MocA family oxidoreductase [Verrucomicrobia bacterium]|nr:Gfo/Idh/MocA family oxidoreductase [Verrucomicrobiota bacterium]